MKGLQLQQPDISVINYKSNFFLSKIDKEKLKKRYNNQINPIN